MKNQYLANVQAQSRTLRGNRTKAVGVGSNNCIVRSSRVQDVTVSSTGITYGAVSCDPLNSYFVTIPVSQIGGAYEFYRIRSVEVEYVPTSGTATAGDMGWAFLDNPELMYNFTTGTSTAQSSILTNAQGVTSQALSMPGVKRWNQSRARTRNWYATNLTQPASTSEYDRSTQVMFIYRAAAPVTVGTVIGKFIFRATYELNSLGNASGYTLTHALDDGGCRIPISCDVDAYPDVVTLVHRQLGEQVYTKKVG